jgi:hypothetical protein
MYKKTVTIALVGLMVLSSVGVAFAKGNGKSEGKGEGSWQNGNLPPGIQKQIEEKGRDLPKGIEKKQGENWRFSSSTTSSTRPGNQAKHDDDNDGDKGRKNEEQRGRPVISSTTLVISNIQASSTGPARERITWTTNIRANGTVFYSTSSPVNLATAKRAVDQNSSWFSRWFSWGRTLQHKVALTRLAPNTTYYYIVRSAAGAGNVATSSEQSFTTGVAAADTTAPVISALSVSGITTSSATVAWTTNENANGTVRYSTTSPVTTSSPALTNGSFTTSHSFTLTGLSATTTYYFTVTSADGSANSTTAPQSSFVTTAIPDTTAPVISAVSASGITSSTATVGWTTDEAATSKVYYSTSTPVITASALSVLNGSFTTGHTLALSGLTASTTYYFVLESKDASNNTATTTDATFTTLP